MQSAKNTILFKIYGKGRGTVFFPADFVGDFTRTQVDNILPELAREGKIRRICTGMYDYPRYSKLLNEEMGPDIDLVARAFSRKFRWQVQLSGNTALNLLGLSTQVPGRYIYLSSGPNRTYKVGKIRIEFQKTALKEIGFKYRESEMIVQALKTLGKDHITKNTIEIIQGKTRKEMMPRILKDTRTVRSWIYQAIKKICSEDK